MPLLDWDDPAVWKGGEVDKSYVTYYFDRYNHAPHIPSIMLDFPRGWHMRGNPEFTGRQRQYFGLGSNKAGDLINTLSLNGKSVVVVGAAFGWTVEGLNLQGANAVGTDLSSWILGEINNTEEADAREALTSVGITGGAQDTFELQCRIPLSVPLPLPFTQKLSFVKGEADEGITLWTINALALMRRDTWGRTGRGAVGKVLGEDAKSQPSRRDIANQVGGSIDTIISEYVLPSLSDAETLVFCEDMAGLADRFGTSGIEVIHLVNVIDGVPPGATFNPAFNWKPLTGASSWRALLNSSGDARISGQQIRRDEISEAV